MVRPSPPSGGSTRRPGSRRKALYLFHRSLGLTSVFLAAIVIFTGAFVVFAPELEVWATRDLRDPRLTTLAHLDVDQIHADARAALDHSEPLDARVALHDGEAIRVTFAAEGAPRVDRVDVDPFWGTHTVARGITRRALRAPSDRQTVRAFFFHLHDRLLLDAGIGRLLTGLIGITLVVSAMTGLVVAWPRRAQWLSMPRPGLRRGLGDVHTLMGAWTALFAILIGATGAYISLAGTLLVPIWGVAFDADRALAMAAAEPAITVPPARGEVRLNTIVALADRRSGPDVPVTWIELKQWDSPTAHVVVGVHDLLRKPTQMKYVYHGRTGQFLGRRGRIGGPPSFGSRAVQWARGLHYGTVTGYSSKVPWLLFGLATTLVAVTGLGVWAARHTESAPNLAKLAWGMSAVLLGMPLASGLAIVAWAVVPSLTGMTFTFVAVLGLAALGSRLLSPPMLMGGLGLLGGVTFVALPGVGAAVTHSIPFTDLDSPWHWQAAIVDGGFLASGLVQIALGVWTIRRGAR